MRKFLLIICVISTVAFAQEKANLCFQKETIDLGTIIEDDTPLISVNFVFSNNGNVPLIIYKVKASCGCTVPNWPKKPIKPRAKSLIKVNFQPKGKKGYFMKTLFVESNSSKKTVLLKIKGVVK